MDFYTATFVIFVSLSWSVRRLQNQCSWHWRVSTICLHLSSSKLSHSSSKTPFYFSQIRLTQLLWIRTEHFVQQKLSMAESFSEGKGLLSPKRARKGPGPGACSLKHSLGLDGEGRMSTSQELMGGFTHYVLGKKDVSSWKNFHWLQIRGRERVGLGAQSIRKYCTLVGCRQSFCKFRHMLDTVASGGWPTTAWRLGQGSNTHCGMRAVFWWSAHSYALANSSCLFLSLCSHCDLI